MKTTSTARWLRSIALALGIGGSLFAASAHAEQKLTLLTWNAPQNEEMFRAWIDPSRPTTPT